MSARSCLYRLPQASASLGQSAAWAALATLAGHTGLGFDMMRHGFAQERVAGVGDLGAQVRRAALILTVQSQ